MNPILGDKVVVATGSIESVKTQLSLQEIINKLASIDAFQIELIGNTIAETVLNNLGPVSTARVAQQVMQKKVQAKDDEGDPMAMMMHLTMMHAMMDIKRGKKQFLSNEDAGKFLLFF